MVRNLFYSYSQIDTFALFLCIDEFSNIDPILKYMSEKIGKVVHDILNAINSVSMD